MCLTSDDGVIHESLSGKKAKAAVARYITWVGSLADDVFESEEDMLERKQFVRDHINTVKRVLKKAKRVSVYAA